MTLLERPPLTTAATIFPRTAAKRIYLPAAAKTPTPRTVKAKKKMPLFLNIAASIEESRIVMSLPSIR
jgi:hypothetical protein